MAILKQVFQWRMLIQFFFGFASGLPLLLTGSTLQAWMTESGVDLKTIGLFALIGLPYSLKFLWAPVMDHYAPPFLDRRRGWMVVCQVLLAGLFVLLGLFDPGVSPWRVAFITLLITISSSSLDIVVDSYRREVLSDEELGFGSSMYVNGYRLGMLLAGAGALFLASTLDWSKVYMIMGISMGATAFFTLIAPSLKGQEIKPRNFTEAVVGPFLDFFKKPEALLILLFLLLYKLGDNLAAHMTMPFYLQKGYSKIEVATIVKGVGIVCTLIGGILGGLIMLKIKVYRSLWFFGFLQMISTAGFALLAFSAVDLSLLTAVIGFENLASGMGTSAFVAFIGVLTNKKFTATQYALLTALTALPRTFFSMFTGFLVEGLGYDNFFVFCTFIALPGMLLLFKVPNNDKQVQAQPFA
jgi:PAT family beta-lactamase induction signal transducer AmpG